MRHAFSVLECWYLTIKNTFNQIKWHSALRKLRGASLSPSWLWVVVARYTFTRVYVRSSSAKCSLGAFSQFAKCALPRTRLHSQHTYSEREALCCAVCETQKIKILRHTLERRISLIHSRNRHGTCFFFVADVFVSLKAFCNTAENSLEKSSNLICLKCRRKFVPLYAGFTWILSRENFTVKNSQWKIKLHCTQKVESGKASQAETFAPTLRNLLAQNYFHFAGPVQRLAEKNLKLFIPAERSFAGRFARCAVDAFPVEFAWWRARMRENSERKNFAPSRDNIFHVLLGVDKSARTGKKNGESERDWISPQHSTAEQTKSKNSASAAPAYARNLESCTPCAWFTSADTFLPWAYPPVAINMPRRLTLLCAKPQSDDDGPWHVQPIQGCFKL